MTDKLSTLTRHSFRFPGVSVFFCPRVTGSGADIGSLSFGKLLLFTLPLIWGYLEGRVLAHSAFLFVPSLSITLRGFAPAPQEHSGRPVRGQIVSHRAPLRYDPLAGRPIPGQLMRVDYRAPPELPARYSLVADTGTITRLPARTHLSSPDWTILQAVDRLTPRRFAASWTDSPLSSMITIGHLWFFYLLNQTMLCLYSL